MDADEGGFEQRAVNGSVGVSHGYSLYAGNAIDAEDKDARERLLRYCLRAPLSLERLSIAPDGNVIYQVKATRHGNETQRVMTPLQFMSRLVALIPPPYHPLLRYFGVFGPHSSWRKSVVPDVAPATKHQHDLAMPPAASTLKPDPSNSASTTSPKIPADPGVASAILAAPARESKQEPMIRSQDVGSRHGAPWRIDWATLLKRVQVLRINCAPYRRCASAGPYHTRIPPLGGASDRSRLSTSPLGRGSDLLPRPSWIPCLGSYSVDQRRA